ncbi:transcriptional regulator [Citrobacter braakii]|uniref:transcriptional regulator n=1 Tax=Citrobacter braakii TaxID=57706 RepID=UPI004039CB48
MNNDVLLIVLTENSWLYAGLAALLPDMVSLQTGFSTCRLPCGAIDARQVLIAVDCRIFFRGEWAVFNALKVLRPDATVVWLTRKETGGLFPVESRGDRILAQNLDITSLHFGLMRMLLWAEPREDEEYVRSAGLTVMEHCLLPYFMSGLSMPVISRLTAKSHKTLYIHRLNILAKTGFRQWVFLQFVCKRNRGLLSIPELEHIDKQLVRGNRSECTVSQV